MTVTVAPLTFRRTADTYAIHPFNPLKLLAHTDRIDAYFRGEPVFPISVELDLSLKCNHGCQWCSFDGWRQKNWVDFPEARVLTLIDELAECGVKSVTLTGGGEPLVHKRIVDVMDRLTTRGIEWGVVTNGWNLKGAIADRIARDATFVRVSLDAGTPQTHQRIHQTTKPELSQILAHMRDVRLRSDRVTIGASFCVFDSNIEEVELAAEQVKSIGGNYLEVRPVYPTMWRGGRQDDQGLSEANIEHAKLVLAGAKVRVQDDDFRIIGLIDRFDAVKSFQHTDYYDRCRITNLTTVISADGQIYACCVHRGMDGFKGGSVLDRPFRDVWLGAQRKTMEAEIDITKCPKCRYVGLNGVLAHGLLDDGMHRNFI